MTPGSFGSPDMSVQFFVPGSSDAAVSVLKDAVAKEPGFLLARDILRPYIK